jgi:hypothetical protein
VIFIDSVLKLTAIGGLAVSDYFTPSNELTDRNLDRDLGSGGPMVLNILDRSGDETLGANVSECG